MRNACTALAVAIAIAGMLAGSFIGLLLLVLLTIGFRIYRVAAANPVHSLRTE